ncbi:MAG: DNA-binding protein [Candidatus Altiarchaeota archaeon]
MIVLLDTNFLLLPKQHKIDIFSEIQRLVPEKHTLATLSPVVEELHHLAGTRTEDMVAAKVALQMLEQNGVEIIPADKEADEAIIEYAAANPTLVATNDKDLKRRLKKTVQGIIHMRGKNHLERI